MTIVQLRLTLSDKFLVDENFVEPKPANRFLAFKEGLSVSLMVPGGLEKWRPLWSRECVNLCTDGIRTTVNVQIPDELQTPGVVN